MSTGLPISSQTLTTGVGISSLSGLLLASPQTTVGYQPERQVTIPMSNAIDSVINSAITNATNSLISNNPSGLPPAFIFNYEGDQTTTIESDITDHYVQDNTAVQDQIALKPNIIATQGFISELNDIPPNAALASAQQLAQKLVSISGYFPSISVTALVAYNEAVFAYNNATALANAAGNLVSTINNISGSSNGQTVITGSSGQTYYPNQNKQQTAFQTFYAYFINRVLFTVQTPFAVFQHMAIKSLRAIQSADTNTISTFEVEFKQIRYVTTNSVATGQINPQNAQGQLAAQSSQPVVVPPTPSNPATNVANVTNLFGG